MIGTVLAISLPYQPRRSGNEVSALLSRLIVHFRIGGSDMMAFVFFLLWMLASLGLLTVWVFRQTPPAGRDERTPAAVAES